MANSATSHPRPTDAPTGPRPKVSVIVPAYKPGDGIRRVVGSLARQTMPASEFELIIVDDGSPDDTWDRLQKIRDAGSNVRITRIENSGWPSRPRNVGIDMARGEYLLFMDHDDEVFPDGLRASYEYATAHRADVLSPKELKTSNPRFGLGTHTEDVPNALPTRGIGSLMPMMPHKFYRRDFLLEHDIRFPEGRRMLWEDVYFNVECYKHAEVVSILSSVPVYLWHATDQNNSATYGPWMEEFWEKLYALFTFIDQTLDTEELADGRRRQILHQYRTRVLKRLAKHIASGQHRDRVEFAVDNALRIIERFVPEDTYDPRLPQAQRPFAWLLRQRRVEDLRHLLDAEETMAGVTTTDDVRHLDGVMELRTTTRWVSRTGAPFAMVASEGRLLREFPPGLEDVPHAMRDVTKKALGSGTQLLLRNPVDKATWALPTTGTPRLERLDESGVRYEEVSEIPDGTRVTLVVESQARFDRGSAAQGARISHGVWDVQASNTLLGEAAHVPVRTTSRKERALVHGVVVVAHADHGRLRIGVSSVSSSLRNRITRAAKGLVRAGR